VQWLTEGRRCHRDPEIGVNEEQCYLCKNEDGELPPGVHVAGWTEIEQRFGTGANARVRALATLKHLHELASRTGALRNLALMINTTSTSRGAGTAYEAPNTKSFSGRRCGSRAHADA